MQTLRFTLKPLSAFGTAPKGDSLFGQLCWVLQDGLDELCDLELTKLLDGYLTQRPFAVLSDLLPHGYIPRPDVPLSFFQQLADADRKEVKKQVWLPLTALEQPFAEWLQECHNPKQVLARWRSAANQPTEPCEPFSSQHIRQHNSISRSTGMTGTAEDGFAPYALNQTWYAQETLLDLYVVFDETRITAEQLRIALGVMGQLGFGRDASIGLGKFEVTASEVLDFNSPAARANNNAALTLAPCAPQGLGFDATQSYYQLFTRFGRHGGQAVQRGRPFKTPVMLAQTGAVFSGGGINADTSFIGNGIGGIGPDGKGLLSRQIPETVQQGYAPVIPFCFTPTKELAV